jgi:hypothetical protein
MKNTVIILMLLVFTVSLVMWPQPQASGKDKKSEISYNSEPFTIKQLNMDFEKQWYEVQKNYPAVAIAFMHQETALAVFAYQRVDYIKKSIHTCTNISNTSVAAAIGSYMDPHSIDVISCVDELVMCDIRANQDGTASVDEIRRCSNDFSNCWSRRDN